jgi:putative flippase GtrA
MGNPSFDFMFRWIKFNVVGALGFALQSGALFAFTHMAHRVDYLLATAAAVELAVLNNFLWHQRWTWRDRPTPTLRGTLRRLAKFNITNGLVSLTGNLVLMSILVGQASLPVVGASVVSVAACALINFLLADRIAFTADKTSVM